MSHDTGFSWQWKDICTYLFKLFFFTIYMAREQARERITSCKLQIKFLNWFIFALVINIFFRLLYSSANNNWGTIYINFCNCSHYKCTFYIQQREILKEWWGKATQKHLIINGVIELFSDRCSRSKLWSIHRINVHMYMIKGHIR